MLRIAVCDDSQIQLADTKAALERFAANRRANYEVITFSAAEDLLASDHLASFDLVFMDIEFEGDPKGIDAVRRLNQLVPDCQVVYLTNYLQYSVDVYRTDHVWFVLKNQLEERLPEMFEKLEHIAEARRSFIVIATRGHGILKLPSEDIVYLERSARITRVVTGATTYEVAEKLSALVDRLPSSIFAYCHSSYVVNMPAIVELHDTELRLANGATVPVSRRYARGFRERYFEWADRWTV